MKERHFKYIYTSANNYYIYLKIRLTTHNYICGQMSKYEVCILNIYTLLRYFRCEHAVNIFTFFMCLILPQSYTKQQSLRSTYHIKS